MWGLSGKDPKLYLMPTAHMHCSIQCTPCFDTLQVINQGRQCLLRLCGYRDAVQQCILLRRTQWPITHSSHRWPKICFQFFLFKTMRVEGFSKDLLAPMPRFFVLNTRIVNSNSSAHERPMRLNCLSVFVRARCLDRSVRHAPSAPMRTLLLLIGGKMRFQTQTCASRNN